MARQGKAKAKAGGVGTLALGDALVLAEQHHLAGRLLEAQAQCRQILEAEPREPNATHLLGLIAHQSGKLEDAIAQLRRAVALAPDVPLYHANLGEMCRLAGYIEEAVAEGRRAVALKPDYPEALSNLGVALHEQKDFEAAPAQHRRAIALNPEFALAHSSLGNALHSLKRFDEAIAAYRRAVALAPNFADAWSNLGTTLHHAGQYEEGRAVLRRAVALAPNHANAHSGLGILLLMRGDLGEGWDEYEWRLQSSEVKGPRFPQRPWQGESLAGRHIYVQAEQGFGDTIQFARYLPMLAARAGRVSLRVHQSLLTLVRESLPGIEVLGDRGTPAPPVDCECALLSLARMFKTRLETIPAAVPYLRPPVEIAQRWHERLGALAGLKVGVVWAGRPEHVNDFRRSVDLAMLAPLLRVPGVSFVSLQVGPAAALLGAEGAPKIAQVLPEQADFAETAGAIAALDLVIAVDTSVAHLAGALAKPTWVLLPSVTDWRWLIGRDDNPWYPTLRLFRQQDGEPWTEVIARVAAELGAVGRGERARLSPHRERGERHAAVAAEIMAAEIAHGTAPPPSPALSPPQAVMLAEQHRRAGRLREAETLSRNAMEAAPGSAEAAHQLGLIAYQSSKLDEAIAHLRRAIALDAGVPIYHANLGEMCRLASRPQEAIAHGRRALELDPENPGALSNVGIALFELKRFEEALDYYGRALALHPDFAEAHSNRGNALYALKRLSEAEAAHRRALELNPRFTQAWNNLGTTLRDLNRPEEAVAAYRKALAQAPNDPDTLDNLALGLKDIDRLDEALTTWRRALSIEAKNDKIHLHLGSLLIDQNKIEEAVQAAERALALNPGNHDTINLMGRIAFTRGDLQQALIHFGRAIALNPDLADAYNNMGNALKELGRLAEAEAAFRKALELDPKLTGVFVNLADSKTFTADDPHLAAMQALEHQDGLSRTDRMHLSFALGKAYADLKDHARSFEHLMAGNAQKRAQVAYEEAATLRLFDRTEAVFTPELVAAKAGSGAASRVPIFILGMPRSGTTLVEQILASHRGVHGAGELKTLDDILTTVRGPDGRTIPYPEFVAAVDARALADIGARYAAALRKLAPRARHVTDKMPSNFFFAGIIHLALPNARIIHTVRDPVDTCISCFSKLFTAEQNHTYDLAELGRYHRRYQALMAHWHRVLPQGRILDVRYEDVVADLEGQARRILAHCGLDWDPHCLQFHRTERPVRTASATQVRQPIYRSAIGRGRVYEPYLQPLLAELNRPDQASPDASGQQSTG
jgi:tetratricopeptide (TPR) repeat protein